MDITELENFKLTDIINFNEGLNPQLFLNEEMRPEIRKQLLKISDHFREFMGVSDISLTDIILTGSNAAYSYTPHSDIDLHLVVDYGGLSNDDVYREMFNAKKYQFNDQHNIKIKSYDVELYVQDVNEEHTNLGEYSVLHDEWNRLPSKNRTTINDVAFKAKYEQLKNLVVRALESDDKAYVDEVLKLIKKYRRAGLSENGNFGPENLAFKMLRRSGFLEKLRAKKRKYMSQELSLENVDNGINEDIETMVRNDFNNFEKEIPENIIKRIHEAHDTIFNEYTYENIHNTASCISEAIHHDKINLDESINFYQKASPKQLNVFTRLIESGNTDKAWQLVRKISPISIFENKQQWKALGLTESLVKTCSVIDENGNKWLDMALVGEYQMAVFSKDLPSITESTNASTVADAIAGIQPATPEIGKKYSVMSLKILAPSKGIIIDGFKTPIKLIDVKDNVYYFENNFRYPIDKELGELAVKTYLFDSKIKLEEVETYLSLKLGGWRFLKKGLMENGGRVVKGSNTTDDVGEDEIKKQAKKMGFNVTKDGVPPLLRESLSHLTTEQLPFCTLNEDSSLCLDVTAHTIWEINRDVLREGGNLLEMIDPQIKSKVLSFYDGMASVIPKINDKVYVIELFALMTGTHDYSMIIKGEKNEVELIDITTKSFSGGDYTQYEIKREDGITKKYPDEFENAGVMAKTFFFYDKNDADQLVTMVGLSFGHPWRIKTDLEEQK